MTDAASMHAEPAAIRAPNHPKYGKYPRLCSKWYAKKPGNKASRYSLKVPELSIPNLLQWQINEVHDREIVSHCPCVEEAVDNANRRTVRACHSQALMERPGLANSAPSNEKHRQCHTGVLPFSCRKNSHLCGYPVPLA